MNAYWMLDKKGDPIPATNLEEWSNWIAECDRRVQRDTYEIKGQEITVSTVFLAIDHNFTGYGPPVLWETMIFGGEHDGYLERYTSKANALEGHNLAVGRVMSSFVGPAE